MICIYTRQKWKTELWAYEDWLNQYSVLVQTESFHPVNRKFFFSRRILELKITQNTFEKFNFRFVFQIFQQLYTCEHILYACTLWKNRRLVFVAHIMIPIKYCFFLRLPLSIKAFYLRECDTNFVLKQFETTNTKNKIKNS